MINESTRSPSLAGKVAIITGSGRGIGRHIALKLAAEGAAIVVNDIDADAMHETVDEITVAGGRCVGVAGSVTDPSFAQTFVDTAVRELGGLHIIVNNAGYTWDDVLQRTSDEQWESMLDVHATAPFRLLRAAQPVISAAARRERETGTSVCRKVVNVSSLAGMAGNPGQAGYSAGKAAVLGLTKTVAKEWGRYNVTVNAVAFGLIDTRLVAPVEERTTVQVGSRSVPIGVNPALLASVAQSVPLARVGLPQEAAGAVYLLCTPESDYITGHTLTCSGGLQG